MKIALYILTFTFVSAIVFLSCSSQNSAINSPREKSTQIRTSFDNQAASFELAKYLPNEYSHNFKVYDLGTDTIYNKDCLTHYDSVLGIIPLRSEIYLGFFRIFVDTFGLYCPIGAIVLPEKLLIEAALTKQDVDYANYRIRKTIEKTTDYGAKPELYNDAKIKSIQTLKSIFVKWFNIAEHRLPQPEYNILECSDILIKMGFVEFFHHNIQIQIHEYDKGYVRSDLKIIVKDIQFEQTFNIIEDEIRKAEQDVEYTPLIYVHHLKGKSCKLNDIGFSDMTNYNSLVEMAVIDLESQPVRLLMRLSF